MAPARLSLLKREMLAAQHVPYMAQVGSGVISTRFGHFVQVFRLGGVSFETVDDERLNTWHERLNVLWRNIANPQVSLWTHMVRRREQVGVPVAGSGFADALAYRYAQRLSGEHLMVNELYLAIVYRPNAGASQGLLERLLLRPGSESSGLALAEALEACQKLAQTVCAALRDCDIEALGIYQQGGRIYSKVLEFIASLLDAESMTVALPRAPLSEVLATSRTFFGTEVIEYRQPAHTRLSAMLGIKEYPTPTAVGMFDRLLSLPFACVLTQSFSFLSRPAAQGLLQRQYHRMVNAGDFAVSQAEELKVALDALTSNEFTLGDHHFSLQVFGDAPEDGTSLSDQRRLRSLNDHVAQARSILADSGMTVAREDLGLEAAYWAQLPGHFAMRPRRAPVSSRNFCAMAPFHNHPVGRPSGNHWGDALATLVTSAGCPYYFSLHASDPRDPEGGSRRDTGHTFICGPTGSGKTVLIGFLVAMLARQGATQVIFDKDRGLEILVRALGGVYLPLGNGSLTGCNPLQLPVTAANEEFLKAWLRVLVRAGSAIAISVRQEADLDQALRGTLSLSSEARRLSRLVEFLDSTDPEGVHARLARWCRSTRGDYGWVFDNPSDSLVSRLQGQPAVGFDVTDFLDNPVVRAPLTLYLFHLVRQLLDGRRLVCWMDEFWRLLADPAFEGFAKDGPKTWRKLNGVMCMATQSVSDVMSSPISRTIVEQTPTKIFFPNPDASHQEYVEGLGLSEREFRLIREQLAPGSRAFLVKQGHHSVVCHLDLRGFDAELAVISGRATAVQRLHELMAVKGESPQEWLEAFMSGTGEQR